MAREVEDPTQALLPVLRHALPSIVSYALASEKIVQSNAEGVLILARHRLAQAEASPRAKPALPASERWGDANHGSETASSCAHEEVEETELFLKTVAAPAYSHKSWTDLRRTLVYLRTEVRFYNEIVPLLLATNGALQNYLPRVYHAECNLQGLVPEDSPATDAAQPSPFPEHSNDSDEDRRRLLQGKGGHILLQSFSPSNGYFQDSPISRGRAASCLASVAKLHASAWGNTPLLRTVRDRLSSAGGSYQLQFRNPKELRDIVASWTSFRNQFAVAASKNNDGAEGVLEKEGVVRLGQRMYDMAEYVSRELEPSVENECATIVHGDFKAMNVFLGNESSEGDEGVAVMIDFSCAGIGYGMSDVAMHIVHAVLPQDLENGGEEMLVEGYLSALERSVNRKLANRPEGGNPWSYPRDIALRHYRLACVDYLRFVMGRFWKSATPESFEKKKRSKNTTLINRNLEAALAFIDKASGYLEEFEKERKELEAEPNSDGLHRIK